MIYKSKKKLSKFDNIRLFINVRKDVLVPLENRINELNIFTLVGMAETAYEKGIGELLKEIDDLPDDILLFREMNNAFKRIENIDMDERKLELLVNAYWERKKNKEEAFVMYIVMLSIMKILENATPWELQQILLYEYVAINDMSGKKGVW